MGELDSMLVAYVDGELDSEGCAEVERLIASCPRARATVEMYRESTGWLRSACNEQVYAADAERLLPTPSPAAAGLRRRWLLAAGAAVAACGVGFVGGASWAGWPASDMAQFVSEVAEYHAVYAREDRHLVEVPADRMDELTQWLGLRLGRRLIVPDLVAEGLRFAGARMLVVDGRPVAQLIYTRPQGRPIGFCLTKLDGKAAPMQLGQRGMQRVAFWQDGRYGFVVVGQADEPTMRAIAADAAAQEGRG